MEMSNPLASPYAPDEPPALTDARIRALDAAAARDEAQADEARERARYQKAQADRSEVDKQINDIRLDKERFSREQERIRHDKAQQEEKLNYVSRGLTGRFRFEEVFLPRRQALTLLGAQWMPGTADKILKELEGYHRVFPTGDIDIVFDSPGGNVMEGFKLFNAIREYRTAGHKVTCGTHAKAASMAGIVLQAGEVRWMGKYARLHMHEGFAHYAGTPKEIEDQMRLSAQIDDDILGVFAERSTLTKAKIQKMLVNTDLWLGAKEAKVLGLIDEIR